MNVPAILGVFRVIRKPALCLPHYTASTFADIPVPLESVFRQHNNKPADIRAIVLDKDNCFAVPNQNTVHASCENRLQELVKTFSTSGILIVSNSSGLLSKDPDGSKAAELERSTGLPVLRHDQPKPACGPEILEHFKGTVDHPSQIVVIGDRLFTDIVLANTMGARSIWIKRGVVPDTGLVTRLEYGLSSFLLRRGFSAPEV